MFAQSKTGKPYSCIALDMWIETSMNKGSKLKAGWLAILSNEKQLLSNIRNVNYINRVRTRIHYLADHKKRNKPHEDSLPSKMKKDEQAIQDLSECFYEFECNPFDHTNQILRSLQSGMMASKELAEDLKSAKEDGETKLEELLNERVYSKIKSLYDRVPRSKRQNFATQEITKADRECLKGKTEEMDSKAMSSVLELVEKSDALKLEDVLHHRITCECLSISNANGIM